ncbi:hypothetical protein Tco_0525579 [Tanacetum coccineum]
MGQSTQTMHMLTKPQVFYDESHKTVLGYQNPLYLTQAQRKVPALYCSHTIFKQHDALSVIDTEETLELAEESRLKMHAKQNDPIAKAKKVNFAPTDYAALNKLSNHFVPQKKLSAEHAFWLPISKPVYEIPLVQPEPVLKEIPLETPTIRLVKDSFNKMRSHVNDFDKVVIVRTKVTGQNEGSWRFEHIRKAFEKDVKPFVNTLKDYFQMFDKGLTKEITNMKQVFNQMKIEVAKCSVERKTFEIKDKELLIENDHLLELIISQDLVHTAVNTHAAISDYQKVEQSYVDEYNECLEHKAVLSKKNDMVDKAVYNELFIKCARMENRCISLEIKVQKYKESLRNNQPRNNQDTLEFQAFFEINEIKAQLKAKDNSISKLKDDIATLKGKSVSEGDKSKNISKVIVLGMYKLDLEPLSPKLLKNREAHVDYLKHTEENVDTLREIVEQARELRPLYSDLDSACKFAT